MHYAVIDASYSQGQLGLGGSWVAHEMRRLGAHMAEPEAAEVILVSSVDPRQASVVRRLRRVYHSTPIIVGGAGALSPSVYGRHATAVCVGNGEQLLRTLCEQGLDRALQLPEVWIEGERRPVEVAQGFPFLCPPIECEDGSFRVWCGHGCKMRCAFCQTGWGLDYCEHPTPRYLVAVIRQLLAEGKRVSYMSNDPGQHSFCATLPPVEHGSYSLAYLRKSGMPKARTVRIGVEGVSSRLRAALGKPITNADLVKATTWLSAAGKHVRWFLIAGLPGEGASDWDELREAVGSWKRLAPKGTLGLSFTAWQPQPAAPLGAAAMCDDYWEHWLAFREWFFEGGGWSHRVKLMMPAAPAGRLAASLAGMDLDEDSLRRGGHGVPMIESYTHIRRTERRR